MIVNGIYGEYKKTIPTIKPVLKTIKVWDEKAIGEKVKKWRIGHGYSLREWCRFILEDPSNYSKAERGKGGMNKRLLDKINSLIGEI